MVLVVGFILGLGLLFLAGYVVGAGFKLGFDNQKKK